MPPISHWFCAIGYSGMDYYRGTTRSGKGSGHSDHTGKPAIGGLSSESGGNAGDPQDIPEVMFLIISTICDSNMPISPVLV